MHDIPTPAGDPALLAIARIPVPPLPEHLVAGKRYSVPAVHARIRDGHPPQWLPILGRNHEDADIVGFEPQHWHIDLRFATDRQLQTLDPNHNGRCYMRVVTLSNVQPQGQTCEAAALRLARYMRDTGASAESVHETDTWLFEHEEHPVGTWYRIAAMECHRTTLPAYPHGLAYWSEILNARYAGRTWNGPSRQCPHRGAPLAGIEPDEDGIVTCPLHGLEFDACTGKVAG